MKWILNFGLSHGNKFIIFIRTMSSAFASSRVGGGLCIWQIIMNCSITKRKNDMSIHLGELVARRRIYNKQPYFAHDRRLVEGYQ